MRLVPKAIDNQQILVRAIKKRGQEETISAREVGEIREIRGIKKVKKTKRNIVTINILLISYYLY